MAKGRAPVALAVLGLVVAAAAAFAFGPPPSSPRGEPAARSFLAAWDRSLRATFVVHQRSTRRADDGAGLDTTSVLAQRPPDRLLTGLGTVEGRLGDDVVRCASEPSGTSRCFRSPGAPAFDDDVAARLDALRGYVTGRRPLYAVIDFEQGCFRLDRKLALPAPPYGDHALFCFDQATGAPSLTVIEQPGITVRTEATSISPTVTDADLQTVVDPGALVTEPLGPPPAPTTTTSAPPPASSS